MFSLIKDVSNHADNEVTIKGWIYNARSSGSIVFLQLRDGSGFIQAVAAKGEVSDELFELAKGLNIESSVELTGMVVADERAPSGYELKLVDLTVVNAAPDDYPISIRHKGEKHGVKFLLDNRHLDLRSTRHIAIEKIRNEIIKAIYDHFYEEGYVKIDSPILTPTSCEDTTELFELLYSPAVKEEDKDNTDENMQDHRAYLTQSGQLYIESAIFAHGKVFDFGPVFRAEKSKTRRHLTEFWMMDAEMAFFKHEDNMQAQEKLIKFIVERVLERRKSELKLLERDITKLEKVVEAPFMRMTHKEAVKELQSMGSDIADRDDLGADDETMLTNKYETPIFLEKYPSEVKAFYMQRDPEDPTRVLNNDLLAPEGYGEIIGGSERMDDYYELKQAMIDNNLNVNDYEWYLDLRKYGSVPHSGYGVGLERTVAWICGLKHIRDTIPFPRMMNRIRP